MPRKLVAPSSPKNKSMSHGYIVQYPHSSGTPVAQEINISMIQFDPVHCVRTFRDLRGTAADTLEGNSSIDDGYVVSSIYISHLMSLISWTVEHAGGVCSD